LHPCNQNNVHRAPARKEASIIICPFVKDTSGKAILSGKVKGPIEYIATTPMIKAPIVAVMKMACVMGKMIMKQFCRRKTAPNSTALLPIRILFLRQIANKSMKTPAAMRQLPMMISVSNERALS